MKKNYKNKFLAISLVTAMLLGSSAHAGKIIGANPPAGPLEPDLLTQFGFDGWNLSNVNVKITDLNFIPISKEFDPIYGTYDPMIVGDTFESEISSGDEIRGLLHGKNWPVGEPTGIKVINGDTLTKHGKAQNCIMTTSYLSLEDNPFGVYGYLDGETPTPTICSSAFQTHKRFKINMMPSTVTTIDQDRYGQPIDLVFNTDSSDLSTEEVKYQVFQKINNYTGLRLDGYKIEVLDENNTPNDNIKFSLQISDNLEDDESGDIAKFSHGLWGPIDKHFPETGFFDAIRAGFEQIGDNTNTLIGGPATLGSSYVDLFGFWLPSKWAPKGIFYDDDNNPTTDAVLMAFWGDPDKNGVNEWHYGHDYSFPVVEPEVLLAWSVDPAYAMDTIEDTLNLGLDYIVVVGENAKIGEKFTIRITPRVAPEANQTAPSYIDGNGDYILPPTDYNSSVASIAIYPSPTFVPGGTLTVAVGDKDLNTDAGTEQNITIVVKNSTGDEENVLLTETDANSSIFTGTLPTDSINVGGINDGTMIAVNGTVVTAYYTDVSEGNKVITASTEASTSVILPSDDDYNPSSGGGGCTYNPNSKNFDMGFLIMMALGLLYPFRRRFIK